MKMPQKSKIYLLIIGALASLIGWGFYTYLRPQIIEAGCADIAEKSSGIYYKNRILMDPSYNFDNLKARCLEDIKYSK